MPIKKIPNVLATNFVPRNEVLTITTGSKKSHYSCSERSLFEALVDATRTSGGYFNVYMATHPFVVISVLGREDKLCEHKEWLLRQVQTALKIYHQRGNVRI